MAHFAELDQNNVVLRVVVVDDKDTSDAFGVEKEHIGAAFLERILGGRWVQTSYNSKIRKRYAGKGMVYLEDHDQFAGPKPSEEHEYNPETCEWFIPGFDENNLQVENVGGSN